jgi:archaellin
MEMTRKYEFKFTIECASDGTADMDRVEHMIDLNMQDLVFDDEFIAALDEKESVSIQVVPQFGKPNS